MTSSRAAPLRRTADHSAFDSVSQPAAMSNDDRPMVMVVDLTLPDQDGVGGLVGWPAVLSIVAGGSAH